MSEQASTPVEKSPTEHAAFTPEQKAHAQARAVEMALILMQWNQLEDVLANRRCGIRARLQAGRDLNGLLERANRLVDEVMG